MMVPRRMVTVLQAGKCCSRPNARARRRRALDQLRGALQASEPQTTLVLVAGSLDKRSRMFKILQKTATIVDGGSPEDVAAAERWVRTSGAKGVDIDPLVERWPSSRAFRSARVTTGRLAT